MATGLIALLDDVVGLAKVAAASLDDAAAHASKAGAKAAGVVVDDAAVTPRYVVGFAADRELPIVAKIAMGSLKNKLLILMPGALVLSLVAPWAITPLLMLGGAFLCYEGAEKAHEALFPHAAHHDDAALAAGLTPEELEEEKVSGAIKTDMILSAEIMAITLSTVAAETDSFWTQALVLALVGIGITVVVYGTVALIVKADDAGVSLAKNDRPAATLLGLRPADTAVEPGSADQALRPLTQAVGRVLVKGMPPFLKLLAAVETAAMLWVGGDIILHGLEHFGLGGLYHALHHVGDLAGQAAGGVVGWLVNTTGSALFGLIVGAGTIPLVHRVLIPAVARLRRPKPVG